MLRIRVVTDSASDLPEEVARRLDIDVVSLSIRFGDEEFIDRVDLTADQFWAKCKASKTLPETAAPSPGAFQAAYQRAADDGCDGVIVVTLSALLSATFQSAVLAADAVADSIEVRVIDTRNVAIGQGLIAVELAELAANGADLDQLEERARVVMSHSGVVATLDTLEHLIKGGRVGGAKALLGQVLAIKPLVELREGVVEEAGRQRTRAKALAAVAATARAQAPFRRLALLQGACSESDVNTLRALIDDLATEYPLVLSEVGPVVGTHGGPGIIGLAWITA